MKDRIALMGSSLPDRRMILAGIALALISLLQGCATSNPAKVEAGRPAVQPAVISAEARADFAAAMKLVRAEEYEKAAEILNKVVNSAPGNAAAHINLALVYGKLGRLKEAEENFKQALIADPENPVAHNEYALLYRKTGRFPEARHLYEKILERHPNFIMVHKNLGILCDLYMKDYPCALKHYEFYGNAVQDDKTVKIWIADVQKRLEK